MKRLRPFFIPWAAIVASCSSGPSPQAAKPQPPAWTQGPPRSLEGDQLAYVGIGEDRDSQNARTKAEAMALQDLANDCSQVPRDARVVDHDDETVGILYRSYARVAVGVESCQGAKGTRSAEEIKQAAQPGMTAQVARYQQIYDAPEPEEAKPLSASPVLSDPAQLLVVRQRLALAKQAIALSGPGPGESTIAGTERAIADFERAHPEEWNGTQAFSKGRPNAINHEALAVRDTIAERARLQSRYPAMPIPSSVPKSKSSGRGGGMGRHRRQGGQPAPQPTDGSAANPGL